MAQLYPPSPGVICPAGVRAGVPTGPVDLPGADSIAPVTAPILQGAEPWSAEGGPDGVLVLHGFTGCPQSMRPLAESLAAAGYSVELPLLPGHGTAVEDLVPLRWEDWSGAAEAHFQALAARCDHVAVVGLSMGGALTCWLAERYGHLAGIALVNPLIHAPGDDLRTMIRGMVDAGEVLTDGIGGDIKKEGVTEVGYDATPLAAILSTFDGADEVEAHLVDIHCPTLLLVSREDHLIDAASGDALVERASGPVERVWLEDSYHVATLDNDAPLIESRVVEFVGSVVGGRA